MLTHVNRLRLAHDDILREVSDIGQARAGHIRVGTGVAFDPRLTTACAKLLSEAPRVTIAVTGGNHPQLLPALRAGNLDLLLTLAIQPAAEDLDQEHVLEDEFIFYCSRRHRLARLKRVRDADLIKERWVLAEGNSKSNTRLRVAFEERRLSSPSVALTSLIPEVRLRTVATTDLVGYSSRALVEDAAKRLALVVLKVEGWDTVRRAVAVVYRKGAYLAPAARRLIDLMKSPVRAPK